MQQPRMHAKAVVRAREMRRQNWSWGKIAGYIGVAQGTVRCALDPEYKAKVRSWATVTRQKYREKHPPKLKEKRERKKDNLSVSPGQLTASAFLSTTISIPESVLLERDRRAQLAPRDLTGALMGDPPIGRSALDQRKPRLVHSSD